MSREKHRVTRASEVGLYVYCARAWWLGQVKGVQPINQAALDAGQAAHQTHGRTVMGYHRLRQAAYTLLGLALALALILLLTTAIK